MINTQESGFALIDRTSTNKLSVIPDIIESALLTIVIFDDDIITLLMMWAEL